MCVCVCVCVGLSSLAKEEKGLPLAKCKALHMNRALGSR